MITNVEVEKKSNENNISILRRFTRKVQGSGILPKARSLRFHERTQSDYTKKKKALKRINRQKEVQKLIKLGKMPEGRGRVRSKS